MKPTDDYLTKREFLTYMEQFKQDFKAELKTELKAELIPELRIMITEIVSEVVGEVVGEIVGDAVQLISKQFANLQLAIEKLDYRLSSTVSQVDGHEVRLRRLGA